jgi:hypothetical protein
MALSHIVLHMTLCNAALRKGPNFDLPVHVVVRDPINRKIVDQTFTIERDAEGETSAAEFDVPWGLYGIFASAKVGRTDCTGVEYFEVLQDHNRTLTISMQDGTAHPPVPVLIMGTSPLSYSYMQPTVVVLPPGGKCNGPVGTPLNADVDQQSDSDGYYASIYPTEVLAQNPGFGLAIQFKDSSGGNKYVRIPGTLGFYSAHPSALQFNIDDGIIEYLTDKAEDTLLCPRLYKTEVH